MLVLGGRNGASIGKCRTRGALQRRFEQHSPRDWLAGAAGFGLLQCPPIGPTAIMRREEWQKIVPRTLHFSRAAICSTSVI
jgi:hypothetical protein